jgi:GDP-L-fucose synthase
MALEVRFSLKGKRVFVAGHAGMVGRALVRRLAKIDCEVLTISRDQLDLTDQARTIGWVTDARPDAIFVAAARVGGIKANATLPASFLYENLAIGLNIIDAAKRAETSKLLYLGASCIYPKETTQPIGEAQLLTGALEPTNEAYALAKIAGIKLAEAYRRQYGCDFISAMPTTLYGPFDNFDPETGHVLPAMMARLHRAKAEHIREFPIWGSGQPRREFLHVDDLADALIFLIERYSGDEPVNIGFGSDLSINELAGKLADIIGWQGTFKHLTDKPDGTFRKLLDAAKLTGFGWQPRIGFDEGLRATYDWYREKY